MIFFPTEMSRFRNRSVWRETVLLFQLLRKAILPEDATLQSCIRRWPDVVRDLSERTRQRQNIAAHLKSCLYINCV